MLMAVKINLADLFLFQNNIKTHKKLKTLTATRPNNYIKSIKGVAGRRSSSLAKQHPATYTMFRNATLYVNMKLYPYMS